MTIPEFISRCDAFCERHDVTRVWLSKRLFQDTYRLRDLAEGTADVGVKRLDRACDELAALEIERLAPAGRPEAAA